MLKTFQYGLCLSRLVGGSRFSQANLRYTNLGWADLRRADFREVDLGGASLYKVNLKGADLSGAFKYGRRATPLTCALAKVGAPWNCIRAEWHGGEWDDPDEQDHWAGLANLYMLGAEDD